MAELLEKRMYDFGNIKVKKDNKMKFYRMFVVNPIMPYSNKTIKEALKKFSKILDDTMINLAGITGKKGTFFSIFNVKAQEKLFFYILGADDKFAKVMCFRNNNSDGTYCEYHIRVINGKLHFKINILHDGSKIFKLHHTDKFANFEIIYFNYFQMPKSER